ncbi:MAG: hypothetical protein AWU57_1017 [Marinobacter sp. T13-3]|nr:MAG: hypothetical protein AWU57_1017 [Marinobacter sp. T13-3]
MLTQEERTDLHTAVLENAYIFLNAASGVNSEMRLNRGTDIAQATQKAELILQRTYAGDDLSYEDYGSISELARDVARQVWNPRGETALQKMAIYLPNENAIGWRMDNDNSPAGEIVESPHSIIDSFQDEYSQLKHGPRLSEMSPYQQQVRLFSEKACRRAVQAWDNLANLAMAGQSLTDTESENRLPRLQVEFVSEPAMRVFLMSSATMGALPENAQIVTDMVSSADKSGRLDNEMLDRTAKLWSQECPGITRQWIRSACEALGTTAANGKLDTLDSSTGEKINAMVTDIYSMRPESGIGHRFRPDNDRVLQDRNQMLEALENIEDALATLTSSEAGANVPRSIIGKITDEADALRELVRAAEITQNADIEDDVIEYPAPR